MGTEQPYFCPHCHQPIYDEDALLCLYCGESLRRPAGFMGRLKYPSPKLIIWAIVLVLSACFILMILG